ncbi:hypothetical protein AAEX28_15870 [Lentisphaerota bacterium WC36G]|nr:hypothetical protein LJT99_15120 [Lentisphaerae bacterium WC36]UDQ98437.1 hypothetical protein LJT99_02630 [Lentisphaerae bacterium WC36]
MKKNCKEKQRTPCGICGNPLRITYYKHSGGEVRCPHKTRPACQNNTLCTICGKSMGNCMDDFNNPNNN